VTARVVGERRDAHPRRPDVAGVLLGAALLATITFAFIQGGHDGLGAPVVVAILVALGVLWAFLAAERRAPDPMLPLELFRRIDFCVANAIAATMNFAGLGLIFVLILYLQRVQDRSALAAGIAMLALFGPLTVLAPLAGRAVARWGARLPMAIGLLSTAAGVALLVRLGAGTGYTTLLPAQVLWGSGLGILTPAVVAAAIAAVPAERAGLASAINNTARQVGGAIGIAALGAVAGPASGAQFIAGLHAAALIAAALLVAAAVAALTLLPAAHARATAR
jgi:DHA2 family methylenomycin A resistance protein-like MFS transporter